MNAPRLMSFTISSDFIAGQNRKLESALAEDYGLTDQLGFGDVE